MVWPPPEGFADQVSRKLTYNYQNSKRIGINKEGVYLWFNSESAQKDTATSELRSQNVLARFGKQDLRPVKKKIISQETNVYFCIYIVL